MRSLGSSSRKAPAGFLPETPAIDWGAGHYLADAPPDRYDAVDLVDTTGMGAGRTVLLNKRRLLPHVPLDVDRFVNAVRLVNPGV
jgi:hypothetical protein